MVILSPQCDKKSYQQRIILHYIFENVVIFSLAFISKCNHNHNIIDDLIITPRRKLIFGRMNYVIF